MEHERYIFSCNAFRYQLTLKHNVFYIAYNIFLFLLLRGSPKHSIPLLLLQFLCQNVEPIVAPTAKRFANPWSTLIHIQICTVNYKVMMTFTTDIFYLVTNILILELPTHTQSISLNARSSPAGSLRTSEQHLI